MRGGVDRLAFGIEFHKTEGRGQVAVLDRAGLREYLDTSHALIDFQKSHGRIELLNLPLLCPDVFLELADLLVAHVDNLRESLHIGLALGKLSAVIVQLLLSFLQGHLVAVEGFVAQVSAEAEQRDHRHSQQSPDKPFDCRKRFKQRRLLSPFTVRRDALAALPENQTTLISLL